MPQATSNQARETIFKPAAAAPHTVPVESRPTVPSVEELSTGTRCITSAELQMLLLLSDDEMRPVEQAGRLFPMKITQYYAAYGIFAPGVRHFMVNRDEAKRLFARLENNTSGHCLPHMITLDQSDNKTRSVT